MRAVLRDFGCRLMEMMVRPDHLAHVRTVIAAAGKFPQLGKAFFEAGPCFVSRLSCHLSASQERAGRARRRGFRTRGLAFPPELIQAGRFKSLMFRMRDDIAPAEIFAGVEAGVDVILKAYGGPKAA